MFSPHAPPKRAEHPSSSDALLRIGKGAMPLCGASLSAYPSRYQGAFKDKSKGFAPNRSLGVGGFCHGWFPDQSSDIPEPHRGVLR